MQFHLRPASRLGNTGANRSVPSVSPTRIATLRRTVHPRRSDRSMGRGRRRLLLRAALCSQLKHAATHCRVYLMHGNRDFLIGTAFARTCGFELIDDFHVIERNGRRVLLCHGDALCTDDQRIPADPCRYCARRVGSATYWPDRCRNAAFWRTRCAPRVALRTPTSRTTSWMCQKAP